MAENHEEYCAIHTGLKRASFTAHVLLSFYPNSVSASRRVPMADPKWPKASTPVQTEKSRRSRLQENEAIDDYRDKEVTDKERIEAAIRIQSRWPRIGRILGPKPFKDYELAAFEQKKEYRDQAQAMLDAWANAHYKKATRRCLIKAMEEEDLAKAAAEVFSLHTADESAGGLRLRPHSPQSNQSPKTVSETESQQPEDTSDKKIHWLVGGSLLLRVFLVVFIVSAFGCIFIICLLPEGKSSGETLLLLLEELPPSRNVLSELTGAASGGIHLQKIDDYLDEPVTRNEIIEVAQRIQSYWRQVGRILGPKPFEEHELDSFAEKKSTRDQAQAMLDAWANKHHQNSTRRCLFEAMTEGGATDAVDVYPDVPWTWMLHHLSVSFAKKQSHKPPIDKKAESDLDNDTCLEETQPIPPVEQPPPNSASKLTGVTVSVNELVQAVVNFGRGKWLDIVLQLDWKFQEALNLETDHPNWTRKKRPQKQLIDVCSKVKIGGTLVLSVFELFYTFSVFLLFYVIC
ncbi:uncharacterized protein [Oscarella lobularis]|uniref:uncharacterized protein isoform X2 n=1 Tax=Oscarella lobularis TaxID=121494 RepID=UPI0033141E39